MTTPVQTPEHEHHAVEIEREGLFIHFGRRRVRLEFLLVALMLAVGATALILIVVLDLGSEDLERWGYAGLFLIALLRSASVVIPVPAPGIIVGAGAVLDPVLGVPTPIMVGLVAGTAESIGELTGYGAGVGGGTIVNKSALYQRVKGWVERRPFLTVFAMSLFPSPVFDVAGLAAGATRVPMRTFLPALFLGKVLRSTFWAAMGYYGVDLLNDYLF
jgi:membrane protein DedA with SNARE-associated domain